ncbi:TolC family outer membrane protein [Tropicimonas sp.]|uniref:TolC family outer membrane protein n=1 Tax=Tropicimonas sp. TaxID=2067044 RepID=UPI003A84EBAA
MTLEDAVLYVLETNPEIQAAEFNKQAIEFELDRAKAFRTPKVRLGGWAGTSHDYGYSDSAAEHSIEGWEANARVTQTVFDGWWTRSEIERQAYRVDAAALRVLERSEVLALEATRLYADVLRMQEQVGLARQNLAYHREVVGRLQGAFDNGVVGPGDVLQAEERQLVAEDVLLEFELDLEDTRAVFLEVVGIEPDALVRVPGLGSAVPGSLDHALATARQKNPTIRFAQHDVGASEAMARRAASNKYPSVDLVVEGRYGEDVDGYRGRVNEFSAGVEFSYEFQGGANRADRQEQVRRTSESRAHLLSQTRLVEREVRQSWNSMVQVNKRVGLLQNQVRELRDLRDTYETEFEVGTRSLLDVLNTQNSLVRAQAELINVLSLDTYIEYRILAAEGVLLPTLGIEPPVDASTYATDQVSATPVSAREDETRFDARSFSNWRKSVDRQ